MVFSLPLIQDYNKNHFLTSYFLSLYIFYIISKSYKDLETRHIRFSDRQDSTFFFKELQILQIIFYFLFSLSSFYSFSFLYTLKREVVHSLRAFPHLFGQQSFLLVSRPFSLYTNNKLWE